MSVTANSKQLNYNEIEKATKLRGIRLQTGQLQNGDGSIAIVSANVKGSCPLIHPNYYFIFYLWLPVYGWVCMNRVRVRVTVYSRLKK